MGYEITKEGTAANVPVKEIFCDTPSDIDDIKKKTCPVGSIVYVISNGDVYIMNSENNWIKQ